MTSGLRCLAPTFPAMSLRLRNVNASSHVFWLSYWMPSWAEWNAKNTVGW
ncbi:unnamed protein product [Penicillium camemberti]|uniref:Str. FM013 n=1 Tax=Penicillium camemberti (strain FM 013) TaxID=1429867 RepID=A0A0G4NX05_PENC3|nr:unnamed protein product [Penicillium camemberti]